MLLSSNLDGWAVAQSCLSPEGSQLTNQLKLVKDAESCTAICETASFKTGTLQSGCYYWSTAPPSYWDWALIYWSSSSPLPVPGTSSECPLSYLTKVKMSWVHWLPLPSASGRCWKAWETGSFPKESHSINTTSLNNNPSAPPPKLIGQKGAEPSECSTPNFHRRHLVQKDTMSDAFKSCVINKITLSPSPCIG